MENEKITTDRLTRHRLFLYLLMTCIYKQDRRIDMVKNTRRWHHARTETCDIRVVHLDRVARARNEAIAEKALERLALTFKIMGDPTRLKIILALRGGEMCVCDIAAFVGLSESAVSHQLRRLRELALVSPRRDGQILYYSLDDAHVLDLVSVGLNHIEEG
jgi:DNA-binding transcriptional ArsR family regulator